MAVEIRLAIAGSTLNYAVETTAGTRPTSGYTKIPEVTTIPEMAAAEYDTVDMTPIDETEEHIEITTLRQAPGTLSFEANLSDKEVEFWNETLMPAYEAGAADGKAMWFCLTIKGMEKALFFKARPLDLAVGGGSVADGWKCTLPINRTSKLQWFDKPTVSDTVLGGGD